MTELAWQGRPKRGARFGSTDARLRPKAWQALISEARNGRLMALGHNGGDEQILGAKQQIPGTDQSD